ncbi:hypothetical protein LV716_00150 [Flagellimonas sp. HMM57]|uniref:hypothetical protein n=1 Tax=unclassified Flagellimonas TaxID=2644544 RepID=UPI0013D45A97|nr:MULTISPECIES: hypothetical protein [unclassified Flagellimonas]UII76245.1 hypothetical protein LV716_00150 [Flagellimonas sp. HMM57]
MNIYLFSAGALCVILGLFHSILGELSIFRAKGRSDNLVSADLKVRHLGIIWATWHLASFLGWCIGAMLISIALEQDLISIELLKFIITSIAIAMVSSSILVFIGTKAKHPGWIVLLGIGILTLLGI